MYKRIGLYISLVAVYVLCIQCANKLSIEGGPKDEQPPRVITVESSRNFQTNFSNNEFTLVFDEFVSIRNPSEQIIVSPPLEYPLTPVTRGKKVIFELHPDEKLLENTTYSIQFGDAIQDYTEGNVLKNERFVFSTGASIDSASVQAHLVDLETGEHVANAYVILYDNMSDTMIRRGRPFYFSKTDSSGMVSIENVKDGQYRIMALVDENKNYKLDLPSEKLGHIDTMITVSAAPAPPLTLTLYNEIEPPTRLKALRIDSTIVGVVLSGESQYAMWSTLPASTFRQFEAGDTTYFNLDTAVNALILTSPYSEVIDTIRLGSMTRNKALANRFSQLTIQTFSTITKGSRVRATLTTKDPIVRIDTDLIRVRSADQSWAALSTIQVDTMSVPTRLQFSWDHTDMNDSLLFLPNSIASWKSTLDTAIRTFRAVELDNLSNLIIEINDLDETKSYVALLKKGEDILYQRTIKGLSSDMWEIPDLRPTKYDLVLITDDNENGFRDGGWFDTRQLPEAMSQLKIDNLRPDWDVQVAIRPK